MMRWACSIVKVKLGAKVITIELAQNALSVEEVDELFSAAPAQTCALKEAQRITPQRIQEHASALNIAT